MDRIKNARIDKVDLFFDGAMLFKIELTHEDGQQAIGAYSFTSYDKARECHVGKKSAMGLIVKIFQTVDVYDFDKLKGTYLRIKVTDGLITHMCNIIKDNWFSIREFLDNYSE